MRLQMTRGVKVLYLHGLGSSINNRTGVALAEMFAKRNDPFERLLYTNPGSAKKHWRSSEWLRDVEERIRSGGDWLLIATSAGGHVALNAAVRNPDRVKGLFLFCPGFDLTMSYVDTLAPGAVAMLKSGRSLVHPASRNGYPALVDYHSFQEFLDMCVSNHEGKIPIRCPVRIVHGTEDETVPYKNSFKLAQRIDSDDVDVTIVEGGTHYLDIDEKVLERVEQFVDKINRLQNSKI